MIVWGGAASDGSFLSTGGSYNPASDAWVATSLGTNVPSARYGHTAVWTGSEMIIWGGEGGINDSDLNDGGRYNPATNGWTAVATANAPDARYQHTAVWTGSEMIVWGGYNGRHYLNDGGRYDPVADSWTALPTTGAPAARYYHTAVWTGSEMIVSRRAKSNCYPRAGIVVPKGVLPNGSCFD